VPPAAAFYVWFSLIARESTASPSRAGILLLAPIFVFLSRFFGQARFLFPFSGSCQERAPSVSFQARAQRFPLLLSRTGFLLLAASFPAQSRFSFLSAGERPSALNCRLGPDPANRARSQLLRFRSAPGLSVPSQPKIFSIVFLVFTRCLIKYL
jgi:hypothetical protein